MRSDFNEYCALCHGEVLGMKWGVPRSDTYLEHYGVKGQKWGVRRYQNYDGTLIKAGSATRRKTKYTNIDGSLNERGKIHSQAYINKQMAKNNKYYERHIKKYEKLAQKNADNPELKKKFEAMVEDAKRTRDSVNKSIREMGIDEIMANEARTRDTALKVAGVVASGALLGSAAGLTVKGVSNAIANTASGVGQALKHFNPKMPMDTVIEIANTTEIGRQAEMAADTALRSYGDARAYAMAILLDQTARRLQAYGVADSYGALAGQFVNAATGAVDQKQLAGLGNTSANALVNIINQAGGAANTQLGNLTFTANNSMNSLSTTATNNAGSLSTTGVGILNNLGTAAANNAGSVSTAGVVNANSISDATTRNAMRSYAQQQAIVNSMTQDQQIAALMNDPNVVDVMKRMSAG